MTDPKEKQEKPLEANTPTGQNKTEKAQESNWDAHQRIDEEGNELDPEDIK